ncbi:MAG TPA: histidine kinase, partial [Candidatus Limnocylindrales bacterium]|nr:histidine kinase [Candidatus Limnocylindrales bacterium]
MGLQPAQAARRVDRDLQAIGALTQAILDGDDIEQLLGRIAKEARVLADAASGVVVTVSGSPGVMTFRGVDGLSVGPLKVGHVMPVGETLTELALIRGTNIVARNANEIPLAGRAFAAATGVGPLIAAPLAQIGTARGVLVVARTADSPSFRRADISLISTFAAQAASAIELFELRSAEHVMTVDAERQRIAGQLHDGVVRALRDLQAGVRGLANGATDGQLVAGIREAVAQLDTAIATISGYVVELEAPPAPDERSTPGRRGRTTASAPPSPPGPARTSGRGSHRTITVMGELARTAAGDGPTDDILQALVHEVLERAGAGLALIGTLTDDGSAVLVRTRSGADVTGRRVGDTIPIGETAAGEAIALGRPVVVDSITSSSITASIPRAVQDLVGPMVAVPLTIRGRRFGALAIGRPVGAPPFAESAVRLIEAYGVQVAIALEFERVRKGLRLGAISAERDRIGRDLHERVIQLLFGVSFALQALESTVQDSSVQASLQAAVDGLDRAIRDLRRFVFGLEPGPVADLRVAERIEALAADNARLQAEIEAQLHEVRASRTRIIAAGDAERKRVERDLHDGAQQRLVSLTLALRLARANLGDDLDPSAKLSLDQASADAKAALSELRELARGIHPQILTEAGLGPAVESLAARSPVDVRVEIGAMRFSPAVEGAVYFTISEALANVAKYAG